ncbi:hypothetical protein N9448_04660 [Litorivicinus sp.]|nr:hypothetical protein [Litorivicinus sp.]
MAAEFRARYIKYNWASNDERLLERALELTEQLLATYQRRPSNDYLTAFNVILTSIQVLHGYTSDYDLLIPTNTNLYSGKTRRNQTHTKEIHTCLKWLIDSGHLIKNDGIRTYQQHKRAKVIWLPQAYAVSPILSEKPLAHSKTIYRNPLCSYVELRQDFVENKKKITRRIEIPKEQFELNSRVIEQTNTVLADYDAVMRSVDIRLGGKPVYSAQTSMTRIFSRGDLRLGGRFYSSIQNMKAEARKYLRFDGDPVIEVDYSSIHPTMLYDYEKIKMEGDPYTIEGFARSDVKVAFNIMLNRNGGETQSSAANTIAEEIHCSKEEAIALEAAIIQKHQDLSNYFNSDSGLKLQCKDSKLALCILRRFTQTLKRPIIMVHDSAIVSVRDTESLILTMKEAYETVIKDKHNFTSSFKAIKADSLDFPVCLKDLVLRSFEGTLNDNDYKKEYWDTCIKECAEEEVPQHYDVSSFIRSSVEDLLL